MSENTRERIVAGAYNALVRNGYEATSIKDIAQEAGVAPGLIHYYFKSKEDLLVAAVRYACYQQQPPPGADLVQSMKDGLAANRDFSRLFFTMIGVGLHNPSIAEAIRDFIREQRVYFEGIVRDAVAERGGDEPEVPTVAATFLAGIIGILIQDLLDPQFDGPGAIDALARMALGRLPVARQAA